MLDAAAALLANAEDLERQWDCTAKGQSGLVRFGVAPMPPRAAEAATEMSESGARAAWRRALSSA